LANGYSTASRAEYFLTYADNEVSLFFDRALTKLFQSLALCDWRPGEIVGMAAVLFRHSGPVEILGWFVSRRSIETTFQESRAHLNGILIKIGAKVVSHGRYAAFQMARSPSENSVRRILRLIAELRRHRQPYRRGPLIVLHPVKNQERC
jgi:hypothetical protein